MIAPRGGWQRGHEAPSPRLKSRFGVGRDDPHLASPHKVTKETSDRVLANFPKTHRKGPKGPKGKTR